MRKPGPSPSRQGCRDHQDHPEERDEERTGCGSCDYEEYGEEEEAEVQLTVVPVNGLLTVHCDLRLAEPCGEERNWRIFPADEPENKSSEGRVDGSKA